MNPFGVPEGDNDGKVVLTQEQFNSLNQTDLDEIHRIAAENRQRSAVTQYLHDLTRRSWDKCIVGPIKSEGLESKEEACLKNCVGRFLEGHFIVLNNLKNIKYASKS
ncbi:MAG: hypothetical protein M1825_003071 [Sarcosagium campestre]|nr:MAG: hypothetical protein M1825_003071 [Sarcosagium campestre]